MSSRAHTEHRVDPNALPRWVAHPKTALLICFVLLRKKNAHQSKERVSAATQAQAGLGGEQESPGSQFPVAAITQAGGGGSLKTGIYGRKLSG